MTIKKVSFALLATVGLSLLGALWYDSRSFGLFVINSAIKASRHQERIHDVAYGEQPWQTLDIYPQPSPSAVIVFIHGGAWYTGTKEQYYFAADAFHRLGYTVVVPDYIKFPEGRFPSFVRDGAKTLAWVKQNIQEYNGIPEQLFVSGHSAGAHTGALLLTDKSYLQEEGLNVEDIRGFAGIAGPYNFTPEWQQYIETFGRENFERMKANTHVDGTEPPVILIHSEGDTQVGYFNVTTFTEALTSAGSKVDNILYGEKVNHINIVLKLHPWFADEVNVAKDIDNFFRSLTESSQ